MPKPTATTCLDGQHKDREFGDFAWCERCGRLILYDDLHNLAGWGVGIPTCHEEEEDGL